MGGLKLQSVGKKVEIKVEAEEFVLVWRGQGTVVVEAEKGRQVVPDAAKRPNISIGISLPKKGKKKRGNEAKYLPNISIGISLPKKERKRRQ